MHSLHYCCSTGHWIPDPGYRTLDTSLASASRSRSEYAVVCAGSTLSHSPAARVGVGVGLALGRRARSHTVNSNWRRIWTFGFVFPNQLQLLSNAGIVASQDSFLPWPRSATLSLRLPLRHHNRPALGVFARDLFHQGTISRSTSFLPFAVKEEFQDSAPTTLLVAPAVNRLLTKLPWSGLFCAPNRL